MGKDKCDETAGNSDSADADMTAALMDETGCPNGHLCCGDAGSPVTSVLPATTAGYSPFLQYLSSYSHVNSSLAVTATAVVKPPGYQIAPLYIRNCTFLI